MQRSVLVVCGGICLSRPIDHSLMNCIPELQCEGHGGGPSRTLCDNYWRHLAVETSRQWLK